MSASKESLIFDPPFEKLENVFGNFGFANFHSNKIHLVSHHLKMNTQEQNINFM